MMKGYGETGSSTFLLSSLDKALGVQARIRPDVGRPNCHNKSSKETDKCVSISNIADTKYFMQRGLVV